MKSVRALVTDKRSGCIYLCYLITSTDGFVTLQSPVKQQRVTRDLPKFKDGNTIYEFGMQHYGEPCRDLMLPNERVFAEILAKDEEVKWSNVTEIEAENLINTRYDEASDKHKRDKEVYYQNRSDFEKFFLRLFGKM